MTGDPQISVVTDVDPDALVDLYSSVGWTAYTDDPPALRRAIANSSYVVTATADGVLVGLARAMSDDSSIFYLQDILVRPQWQHRGIGTALLAMCTKRYGHVRQKVLLTDDQPSQHRFYEKQGYTDIQALDTVTLHTFVQIEGI